MKLLPILAFAALASVTVAAVPPPIHSFVEKWCIDCHDGDSKKGGLNLDGLEFSTDEAAHAKWVRVFDKVLAGEMPPPEKSRADESGKRAFLTVLGTGLVNQHTAMKGTVLRRLNRSEYENSLRDLLGARVDVRDLLPEDSLSHGFDNIGEALGMSEVQLKRYLEAAETALDVTFARSTRPETTTKTASWASGREVGKHWLARSDGSIVVFNSGSFPDTTMRDFRAPAAGDYRLRIAGYGFQTSEAVVFALHVGTFNNGDATLVGYYELPAGQLGTVEVVVTLGVGETLKISPNVRTNQPAYQAALRANDMGSYTGPGLALKGVEIEGPLIDHWPPRGQTLLYGDLLQSATDAGDKARSSKPKASVQVKSDAPDADASRLLRDFATAAFRRPADEAKTAPYLALVREEMKKGATFAEAMRTGATAILCAPDFLYLREPAGKLDDFALASRLAYFLTRTMPDAELLREALAGKLSQPATLRAQTERLLSLRTQDRFVADFTDGWLNLRDIEFTTPDRQLYPEFDGALQDAMVRETRAFFAEVLNSNLAPITLLKPDFAMLNARLAAHYDLPPVPGQQIRKVKLPAGSRRGGLLTHASVLKVSANGTNTSPVIRGAYVLERILGVTPPPPPPGVPGLEPDIRGASTLRELLDKHREMESCQGCHKLIDPPGFALESFDVIGGWREHFRSIGEGRRIDRVVDGQRVRYKDGPLVDASGQLINGQTFAGFDDFQNLLIADPLPLTKCVTEKLLTFASGRELGFSDRTAVARIASEVTTKKGGLRDLLHLVVQSEIFRSK